MKDKDKSKEQLIHELIELRHAVEALKDSEFGYRSLVESTEDSIYLIDRDCKYLFINKKHLLRLGISESEYPGKSYSDFHSPDETGWFVETVSKVFDSGKSVQEEHQSRRDGRYFLLTLSPTKADDGRTVAVTVVSKNISELKRMAEELRALSLMDELTGLYNRRGFYTLVEQQLKMAKRLKKGIFMLYADIDDLKRINDTFGHNEGDQVLIETANILKENYRDSDIIARISGDEFVMIPVETSGDNVEIVTTRLQERLDVHNAKNPRGYKLSFSAGLSYYDPENPTSVDDLIFQADKAMYEQKKRKQKT